MPEVIPESDARQYVLERVVAAAPQRISLSDATGLVLAEAVVAGEDVPPFVNSAVDGYAVRAGDVADAPVELVVIDEVAGVIVMGDAVRISTVAIQQGNLTITVKETSQVSQPSAFSRGGTTAVVPQSDVSVDEEKGKQFVTLKSGASLASLVSGLNALGATDCRCVGQCECSPGAGGAPAAGGGVVYRRRTGHRWRGVGARADP